MFLLAPDLYAMSTQSGQDPGFMGQIILFGAIFLIFFLLVIRPQQRKAKQHRELLSALQKGDQVITSSGMYGKVDKCFDDKDYVLLEIANNTVVKIQKSQIGAVVKSKAKPDAVEDKENSKK